MGAEAGEVEAADVAIIVLAADLPHVAVAVGAHELVELLPDGVHVAVRGTSLPSPSLGFSLAKRARRGGGSESGPFGESDFREEEEDTKMGLGWNTGCFWSVANSSPPARLVLDKVTLLEGFFFSKININFVSLMTFEL